MKEAEAGRGGVPVRPARDLAGQTSRGRARPVGVVLAAMLAVACSRPEPPGAGTSSRAAPAAPASRARFRDVTAELGLPPPETWPRGTHRIPEIMGAGVALFDHDGDGDLDILQVRSPPPGPFDRPAPNRLHEQRDDGTFVDVSEEAGLADTGFGQGVAIGDVDADGDLDVFVSNYRADALYRNRGDGTFEKADDALAGASDGWSTSAAFFDADADGDLDLWVVRYVDFDADEECLGPDDVPDYCAPSAFDPLVDVLYRNDGRGRFADETAEAGIDAAGAGLGVLTADFTGDGLVDVFVANDGMRNHLWVNGGDGTFREEGLLRGVAFNAEGRPEASMGVDAGDLDGDGRIDLFMTHLGSQTNTLYRGGPRGTYLDTTGSVGMAPVDLPYTGFGCGFIDHDLDGDLDVAVVNGRVSRGRATAGHGFWWDYAEPNLLFRNDGRGRLESAAEEAGPFASAREVSRGLAWGDLDEDGDVDLVVGNLGGVRVLRNEGSSEDGRWLRVRCLARGVDAAGARITIRTGDRRLVRIATPARSYASSCDPRVHVGLGGAAGVDAIEVVWPDGAEESFESPGLDRDVVLIQGRGRTP